MKKLTRDELVAALRCCTTTINCNGCPLEPPENYDHCMIEIDVQAADMLENHETERLALVKEIEKLRKQVEELTKAGLFAADRANQAIEERDAALQPKCQIGMGREAYMQPVNSQGGQGYPGPQKKA